MALSFVLDEQLRGQLWQAVQHLNATRVSALDVVRVGDVPGLPLSTADPDLLLWCESHGRILISEDRSTLPGHLTSHYSAGHHLPGVLFLKPGWKIASVLVLLDLYDQCLAPADFQDRIEYIA